MLLSVAAENKATPLGKQLACLILLILQTVRMKDISEIQSRDVDKQ